jgi:hypothetical protein
MDLLDQPQFVLSIPHALRALAAFDPRVLTALNRLFVEALSLQRRSESPSLGFTCTQWVSKDGLRNGSKTMAMRYETAVSTAELVTMRASATERCCRARVSLANRATSSSRRGVGVSNWR